MQLFKAAAQDGSISFDEERIIRATDLNVQNLVEYVDRAWEDKKLTEQEIQTITFLIKKIKDDAVSLAMYDEILSDQEEDLLDIIKGLITEFFELYHF